MSKKFVIVDYHKGNLSSVARAFSHAGAQVYISDNPQDIRMADAIIVPGVGAFADAIVYMEESGQADAIRSAVEQKVPYFGICLGMQVVFERGNEHALAHDTSWTPGLGLLPGQCIRLNDAQVKVPHMGWNQVELTPVGKASTFASHLDIDDANMYFTHSYVVTNAPEEVVIATTSYGDNFVCMIEHGSIFGCQFHPEKSSAAGERIINAFVRHVHDRNVT
ncbi:MAG: imidazole glycerol phosphate synthase subunit HisH [Eggerthellaceae bacterium]|nr:imidazole glycerol phosphate synthase subunit HisH [Eggerthellaceae bacterium]